MIRWLALPGIFATLVFLGAIWVARALPHDTAALRDFLAADRSCPLPCWYGIRPGETLAADAYAILRAHPWVDPNSIQRHYLTTSRAGSMTWNWNGRQPAFIDNKTPGSLVTLSEIVQHLVIRTTIPMGELQAFYGPPDRGLMARDATDGMAVHYAVYGGLNLRSVIACPLAVSAVWHAPVEFALTPEFHAAAFRHYEILDWLRQPPCPD